MAPLIEETKMEETLMRPPGVTPIIEEKVMVDVLKVDAERAENVLICDAAPPGTTPLIEETDKEETLIWPPGFTPVIVENVIVETVKVEAERVEYVLI